ncbi:DUF429 domain-containing protein [Actinokineospora soli]
MDRVLGVDACKTGWVGIALGEAVDAYYAETIADLVAKAGSVCLVAVDMPIGLPDIGCREADVRAREEIGGMWLSVFMTPTRAAIDAPDYASANERNRDLDGGGISKQAYSLRTKLLEVDRWVRETPHEVVEVHPEVSFAKLNGQPLVARKKTWAGAAHRRRLLAGAGIVLRDDLGEAGKHAAVDDVLDGAAAAWTARRVAKSDRSHVVL